MYRCALASSSLLTCHMTCDLTRLCPQRAAEGSAVPHVGPGTTGSRRSHVRRPATSRSRHSGELRSKLLPCTSPPPTHTHTDTRKRTPHSICRPLSIGNGGIREHQSQVCGAGTFSREPEPPEYLSRSLSRIYLLHQSRSGAGAVKNFPRARV